MSRSNVNTASYREIKQGSLFSPEALPRHWHAQGPNVLVPRLWPLFVVPYRNAIFHSPRVGTVGWGLVVLIIVHPLDLRGHDSHDHTNRNFLILVMRPEKQRQSGTSRDMAIERVCVCVLLAFHGEGGTTPSVEL